MIASIEAIATILLLLFIISYKTCIANKNDVDYLSPSYTVPLRGLLAISVLLCHVIGEKFYENPLLSPIRYCGFLSVSLFFFLSGYGLRYGYLNKSNYLNGFVKKRVSKVLVPYWIADTILSVISVLLIGNSGGGYQFNFLGYSLSLALVQIQNNHCWFVQEIVVLYFLFFVSYKFGNKNLVFYLLFFLCLFSCICLGIDDLYYRSSLAFVLGILWCDNKAKIDERLSKQFLLKLLLAFIVVLACFALKYFGHDQNQFLFEIGNLLSSLSFCIFTVLFLKRVRISNKLLTFFGGISYEIYLVHHSAMVIARKVNIIQNHPLLYVLFVVFMSIALAFLVKTLETLFSLGIKSIKKQSF